LYIEYPKEGKLMAHKINTDDCINCGACESECPEGAISEIGGNMVIDDGKCVDCAACVDVCPSDAIHAA
jgi:ferredoxin